MRVAFIVLVLALTSCDQAAEKASWDRRGVDMQQGGTVVGSPGTELEFAL